MNKYIVYRSKIKQLGFASLTLSIALVFFLVFIAGCKEFSFTSILMGLIGLAFFGGGTYYLVKQITKSKELVILNEAGFYDFSTSISPANNLIGWDNVRRIEKVNMINHSFVSVYLKRPEEVLDLLSSEKQKAIIENTSKGFGEININLQNAKEVNEKILVSMMTKYLTEYRHYHKEPIEF
ncbi:STM3941 family protein [Vaginisenegalia massiliensis]|uniref:STM3941 family protein n=1 Tax=Vaginisenegalia massiliensis TaxID=2058294 RepID=UPI000F52FA51|nr:STM3941 family protein [Vaginisenegalia massiliensis]